MQTCRRSVAPSDLCRFFSFMSNGQNLDVSVNVMWRKRGAEVVQVGCSNRTQKTQLDVLMLHDIRPSLTMTTSCMAACFILRLL